LIRAYNLQDREDELVQLAKNRPGRKVKRDLAERIWRLRHDGKNVRQIKAIFEAEGQHLSEEAIKSYLKTRRKKAQGRQLAGENSIVNFPPRRGGPATR
jgi:uncharacterized protein (UPF0335 family)